MMSDEQKVKRERVRGFLKARGLGGVALTEMRNFAWYSCGGDSHVVGASEMGFATLVITPGRECLVTADIEAARFHDEETGDRFEILTHPWHEPAKRAEIVLDLLGGKPGASDDGVAGLPRLGEDFAELRYTLTPPEVERYRALGRDASRVMSDVCAAIVPGQRECDVAGDLAAAVRQAGMMPTVILIAADERVSLYRHPIVTDKDIREHVMVVLCARRHGLVCSLTRMVHFGKLSADLHDRHAACCAVDAAFNLGTRAGRTGGEVFREAITVYAKHGFPEEWRLHHQGGAAGYREREWVANAADAHPVLLHQAFAWNPSISGTKSEDTILLTESGPELLTFACEGWPVIQAEFRSETMPRPAILEK